VPIIFQDRRMGASKISRSEIVKAARMVLWLVIDTHLRPRSRPCTRS